jgi:hypothetical protein
MPPAQSYRLIVIPIVLVIIIVRQPIDQDIRPVDQVGGGGP